jgi:ankyrin repeat protein
VTKRKESKETSSRDLDFELLEKCILADAADVSRLILGGANVNCLGKVTGTPLIMVARFCNVNKEPLECAKILIESAANVNLVDINGETALCEAVDSHSIDLVKLFVSNGACVNGDELRINPLSMGTDLAIAEYLLEHGADPFKKDKNLVSSYEYFSKLFIEHEFDEEEYKPDFRSILVLFDKYRFR